MAISKISVYNQTSIFLNSLVLFLLYCHHNTRQQGSIKRPTGSLVQTSGSGWNWSCRSNEEICLWSKVANQFFNKIMWLRNRNNFRNKITIIMKIILLKILSCIMIMVVAQMCKVLNISCYKKNATSWFHWIISKKLSIKTSKHPKWRGCVGHYVKTDIKVKEKLDLTNPFFAKI